MVSKKSKPVKKSLEFVLLNCGEQMNCDTFLLDDDYVVLRGIVTLNSHMKEEEIRACLAQAVQLKFPSVAPQDFEFLKAIRRKLSKPVNTGKFSFQEVKLLAGQGSIYVKLKDGFQCLLENGSEDPCHSATAIATSQEEAQDDQEARHESLIPQETKENLQDEGESYLYAPTWAKRTEVDVAIEECLEACKRDNTVNPVEILRCVQKHILQGRVLDTTVAESTLDGDTNYIDINRYNLLETTFQELNHINNLRLTLQVSFYGEMAHDNGGPRKEFFTLCLREIKEKFFDNGLREVLADNYEKVGIIMAMSIIQNGPVPRFLEESILKELFEAAEPSPCIAKLRLGFAKLGLYQIGKAVPIFIHLMRPSPAYELTRRKLISLLPPSFSEEGSNARRHEMETYERFQKYMREASSGRRGGITLGKILQFATGVDEEPPLGFSFPPGIHFNVAANTNKWAFVPTANTCTQTMFLPRGAHECPLPLEEDLFDIYDNAFNNVYFGLA